LGYHGESRASSKRSKVIVELKPFSCSLAMAAPVYFA
jgi:hypothetical protein